MNPLKDQLTIDALTSLFELVLPEIALVGAACLSLLACVVSSRPFLHYLITILAIVGAGVLAFLEDTTGNAYIRETAFRAPILATPAAAFARWLILGVGFLIVLISRRETGKQLSSEYLSCLLVALAGTSLVTRANDLVMLYLALEMISIPTYVLLYLPSRNQQGQESAIKYFLLSILSSAILLFGLSYLYGLTGTTNLTAISATLVAGQEGGHSPLATLAVVFAIAGIGFRITAVPFHYYAPDVYQGGPTAVIAQLAILPKIAGFFALANLLGIIQRPYSDLPFPVATQIPLMLWVLAAATMTFGNTLALLQDNLKRMLAYSGIAHSGYMLLGLVTATAFTTGQAPRYANGWDAILYYLVAYSLMSLAVFAVLIYLNSEDESTESVDDLAGLHRTHPVSAAVLLIALLSMIGMPLTAGFAGKLGLFIGLYDAPTSNGMGQSYKTLTVFAAINAAIGAVVYLRVLGAIFLRSPLRPESSQTRGNRLPLLAAILCSVGTIVLGFYPQLVWHRGQKASTHPADRMVNTQVPAPR